MNVCAATRALTAASMTDCGSKQPMLTCSVVSLFGRRDARVRIEAIYRAFCASIDACAARKPLMLIENKPHQPCWYDALAEEVSVISYATSIG